MKIEVGNSISFLLKNTRSVQKLSSRVIRKIETFIAEDTRNKKHCT